MKQKINPDVLIKKINTINFDKNNIEVKNTLLKGLQDITVIVNKLNFENSDYKLSWSSAIETNKEKIQNVSKERALIFLEMEKMLVSSQSTFLMQIRKLVDLSFSFFLLAEKDELLGASLVSRGIHEIAAFLVYVRNNFDKKIKILFDQKDPKKILKELKFFSKFFEKVFYSSKTSELGHIHINDARKEYQKNWPTKDIEISNYNKLCEYVHPNYGSNTLFGTGTPTEYNYINSENVRLGHLAFLLNINTINLKQCDNCIFNFSSSYFNVADFCKNIVDDKIKIENIFNNPKVDISKMDGKTVDNPIVLEKARSISEQSKMIHITLEKMNLDELDHSVIQVNGQLYHESKTDKGSLFFKLNVNLPI